MAKLINIQDIDQFSEVISIPNTSINQTILSNVRNLDEKKEMEQSIREILFDPNETAHGPTEIADILTTHINVRGKKLLAAFVLKGKSYKKVSSKTVTHQFAKLRQLPRLGMIVFGAVGNIQDDAQRDFIQSAIDIQCDYLIIDAVDWARLLIAYEKICPKDGIPYDEMGTCCNGHIRDDGLTLEMEVKEKNRYTITKQSDVSHPGAKRYSAIILLDRHYPKDIIRTSILAATNTLKESNYYRNDRIKLQWGKTPAHVIWLYIAYDLDDIRNVNWVCRTCWIDPSLQIEMQPSRLKGNETLEEIEVLWNDEYNSNKNFFESYSGTKEQFLETLQPIFREIIILADKVIKLFEEFTSGSISEDILISKIQKIEPKISGLYFESGNIPMPPEDCKDYDLSCQNIFATIHNMVQYFTEKGLETWDNSNRVWLMQDTIKRYHDDFRKIEFEESKIH